MIKRLKYKKVSKKLDYLVELALKRRSGTVNIYDNFRDFLDNEENIEYSRLACEHRDLSLSLNRNPFKYFNPKYDFKSAPNSPKGLLTVTNNTSTKVSWEWDEEYGVYIQLINNKRNENPMEGYASKQAFESHRDSTD